MFFEARVLNTAELFDSVDLKKIVDTDRIIVGLFACVDYVRDLARLSHAKLRFALAFVGKSLYEYHLITTKRVATLFLCEGKQWNLQHAPWSYAPRSEHKIPYNPVPNFFPADIPSAGNVQI
jgi:hypothetical protein